MLTPQAMTLLSITERAATGRLGALARAGCVRAQPILDGGPVAHQITRRGIAVIGSDLQPPRPVSFASFAHDVGTAWLWLAARAGRLGPVREVIGERRLRSHDAREEREGAPLGVRLGGVGWRGGERLHYPDVLLVSAGGRRVAVELELSRKGSRRREGILAGYGADGRIDAVLYLVENGSIGRSIERSASRLGLSDLVRVQSVQLPGRASDPLRARVRTREGTRSGPRCAESAAANGELSR